MLCGAQPIEMALDMCCGGRDGLNAQFAEAGAAAWMLPAVPSVAGMYAGLQQPDRDADQQDKRLSWT